MQWNEDYRKKYEVPTGTYVGRSPYMRSSMDMGEPLPPPPPPPAPNSSSARITISKAMPDMVTAGEEFPVTLTVQAEGNADNVVVRDTLPEGVMHIRSEPPAAMEGNQLVWRLGRLKDNAPVRVRAWLRAERPGSLVNCASASVEPNICVPFIVGQPNLTIEKSGPATAVVGATVIYNIVVKNTGTSTAKNVVVSDPVPSGYSHASGQSELSVNIGDLAPGQSKALSATFKANQRGKVCNVATATSSNAGKVSDDACTTVQQPGLKVTKTGLEKQIIGRKVEYQITVQNTGDMDLANVNVVDTAPENTSLIAAPGASINGNRAAWTTSVPGGGSQSFTVTVIGRVAGNLCNNVTASSMGLSDSAQACTTWRGVAGVLLEMVDDLDPIQVGENNTYTFRVTNQGFADIHNAKLVAEFDKEVDPISSPQGSVSGKTVTFPTVANIAPKTSVTYTVVVKGAAVGDARNKATFTSDELKSPVVEEESTTVY